LRQKGRFGGILAAYLGSKKCWEDTAATFYLLKLFFGDKMAANSSPKFFLRTMWHPFASKKSIWAQLSLSVAPKLFFGPTDKPQQAGKIFSPPINYIKPEIFFSPPINHNKPENFFLHR
jgi:hypothetical protein